MQSGNVVFGADMKEREVSEFMYTGRERARVD
jgi:hypothetical protein